MTIDNFVKNGGRIEVFHVPNVVDNKILPWGGHFTVHAYHWYDDYNVATSGNGETVDEAWNDLKSNMKEV
jgi:hypothetical protein